MMLAYVHPQSRAYQWSADVVSRQDYEGRGHSHRAYGRTEAAATQAAEEWARANGFIVVEGPDELFGDAE